MKFKNLLILVVLVLIGCLKAVAVTDADYLSGLEQELFSVQYNQDSVDARLDRLEMNVFGKSSNAPQEQRILKLKKVFNTEKPQLPVKILKPQKKLAAKQVTKPSINNAAMKTDATVQYPVVDEIEMKVLGKTAKEQDIGNRLNKLESTIFNKTYDDPLVDRVERLKLTVLGVQNTPAQSDSGSADNMDDASKNLLVNQLEKEVFNTTYPNESMDSRLTRLEMQEFNQPCKEESDGDRIERLAAVISAQPSTELYKDMNQVRRTQSAANKITAAALILLIIGGLLF